MRELQDGLWHWQATHPEWTEEDTGPWGPEVSSYALRDGDRLVLIDPVAPPPELERLAEQSEVVVVLTNPWHERDAESLVARFGAGIFLPQPEDFNDDVAWLRPDLERLASEGRIYGPGDRLPIGAEVFLGRMPIDVILWFESRGALVIGDTLADFGNGLELPVDWLPKGTTREQAIADLRPVLELPATLVLPTHGAPTDRSALVRALAA